MALKYHSALLFGTGHYPLWNSYLFAGIPAHTGIGIADLFILPALFFKGVHGLLGSAAFALWTAGVTQFYYLRHAFKLSKPAALLGAALYMGNPFFGAVCHEQPFMAPPVWLPLALLLMSLTSGFGLIAAFWSGAVLSLTFLSGNLESFYFCVLFFVLFHLGLIGQQSVEEFDLKKLVRNLVYVGVASGSAFMFSAVDMLPTLTHISDAARPKDGRVIQNFILFAVICVTFISFFWVGSSWSKKIADRSRSWVCALLAVVLFLLFSLQIDRDRAIITLADNIIFIALKPLMLLGQDLYHWLLRFPEINPQSLRLILEPRYIFYIQNPGYLFTLPLLLLFMISLTHKKSPILALCLFIMLAFSVLPYTPFPNLYSIVLRLMDLNYARLMFIFFLCQSAVCACGFECILCGNVSTKAKRYISLAALIGFGMTLIVLVGSKLAVFDAGYFQQILDRFGELKSSGRWIELNVLFLRIRMYLTMVLTGFNQEVAIYCLLKASCLFALLGVFYNHRSIWRWIFVVFMGLETLWSWSLYTFQTNEIQNLLTLTSESRWMTSLSKDQRIGTLYHPKRDPFIFYDQPEVIDLSGNYPIYWNQSTVEEAGINLLPRQGKKFWLSEQGNKSVTPSSIIGFPSIIYDLMGMNYLLSDNQVTANGFRLIQKGDRYYIYENSRAMPRFYFPKRLDFKSQDEILRLIHSAGWDPGELTYIHKINGSGLSVSKEYIHPAEIQTISSTDHHKIFELHAKSEGFLATTDAYHAFWKAKIDGIFTPLYCVNGYFKGLFYPQGSHRIEFLYLPTSFVVGAFVSSICFLFLIGFTIVRFKSARVTYD